MSDRDVSQAEAETPEVKAAVPKTKKKASNGKQEEKKPKKKEASGFEFTGRVEGINIKGTGGPGGQFLFRLMNKKGEHRSYILDPSNAPRFGAMASLLCSAFEAGAKVHLNSAPSQGPTPFAGEIEVRAKP